MQIPWLQCSSSLLEVPSYLSQSDIWHAVKYEQNLEIVFGPGHPQQEDLVGNSFQESVLWKVSVNWPVAEYAASPWTSLKELDCMSYYL
jgi:hypothetical protein